MRTGAQPAPSPHDDPAEIFFAGARAGILMIQRCPSCGAHQYPLPGLAAAIFLCRSCATPRPQWIAASGTGSVVSFTVLPSRRGAGAACEPARVAGIVELVEGPWVFAVLDMHPGDASLGTPVQVTFTDGIEPDRPVPVFQAIG